MAPSPWQSILVVLAVVVLALVAVPILVGRWRRDVPPGMALVIDAVGKPRRVSFASVIVAPFLARTHICDCTTKTLVVDRTRGYRCRDNVRVRIVAHLQIAVNGTIEDVLKVVANVGAERAADMEVLQSIFAPKLEEALASVVIEHDHDELQRYRVDVRDRVLAVLGADHDGWVLRSLALVDLEPVPLETYDTSEVLDAVAVRNITERTARANVERNEIQQRMRERELAERLAAAERGG